MSTGGTTGLFTALGVTCIQDARSWWANDQPGCVSAPTDANYRRCLGWTNTPATVPCSGAYPTVQRLCRCDRLA
jgi:hypothetical protein